MCKCMYVLHQRISRLELRATKPWLYKTLAVLLAPRSPESCGFILNLDSERGNFKLLALYISSILESLNFWGPVVEEES